MAVEQYSSGASVVSEEAVRAELAKVAGSAAFQQASRAQRLLRFLVEETLAGRAIELKEYVVGVEVFDKQESFDPRTDSSVRVEIARLRTRLDSYYHEAGVEDPVVLRIPKGAYGMVFDSRATAPVETKHGRWPAVAVAAVVVVLAAAVIGLWLAPRVARAPDLSLAVLPFAALNGSEEAGFRADGLTEELTAILGGEPRLKVAARTSATRFKGRSEDVRTIASQLQVAAVIEGSVQEQPEGRLRVTVQLIDGRTGYHRWSRIFEGERGAVRSILDDVAAGVNEALGIPPPEVRHRPAAPEVEALYFQGIYLRNRRDEESRERGLAALEAAAVRDGGFAPAQAALAMIYAGRYFQGDENSLASAARAKAVARQAIASDERNAKAHTALGWMLWFHDRDWAGAERAFRRALQLNPSLASAHNLYGLALTTRGRFDEALAETGLARTLDPLNYLVSTNIGLVTYCAGRSRETEDFARAALKVDPDFLYGHELLGISLAARGRLEEALPELRKVAETSGHAEAQGRLGYALGRSGDRAGANTELTKIGSEARFAFARALVHCGMGDRTRTLAELETAASGRAPSVMFAGVDPAFAWLRGDDGFERLMHSMGLR